MNGQALWGKYCQVNRNQGVTLLVILPIANFPFQASCFWNNKTNFRAHPRV